jgi:hypothetical protein
MHVDRAGFFMAIAAIAGACGPKEPSPAPVVAAPLAPPVAPPTLVPSDEPAQAGTSAGASASASAHGSVPPNPTGDAGPTQEGAASVSDDDTAGTCRATAEGVRPATCDDDHGTPGACAKAPCQSLPFVCEHCDDYKRYFKPKVAARAVACVVRQSRAEAEDGCRTYQCGDEALKSACLDRTADATCAKIASACGTTVDECRGMLSGMNAAGRAKIAACAAKGCSFGLWSCIEGI